MTFEEIIPYITNTRLLVAAGAGLTLIIIAPAFVRWRKTVRCPACGSWFKLDYQGFSVRDKVTGHSSTTFGGGLGGLLGRVMAFIFGYASRTNADPFIREWGTARFICKKCECVIDIDTRRDRK